MIELKCDKKEIIANLGISDERASASLGLDKVLYRQNILTHSFELAAHLSMVHVKLGRNFTDKSFKIVNSFGLLGAVLVQRI